ncbi:MAG TPA: 3-keto-5-aminohexanoate cleavage protein [Acidimicrobiia bacterium]|nr:3-keto-5-aminohexanoate cleavage protein [Acidimicrobiia bacterium]
MSAAAPPTVIEAAVNGMVTKEQNPHVPRTVDEIVEDSLRCLDAGASIVHHHNDEPNFGGPARHSAHPYIEVWTRLRAAWPGLLLHPTSHGATADSTIEERYAHVAELHEAGLAPVGTCDAGMLALAAPSPTGGVASLPETFGNPAADVEWILRWHRERELPVHISIFEPGFLRLILAHRKAGTLPREVKIQLYLGGDRLIFGLPATPVGLAAYLDMLEGTGLSWMAAVFGGDVVASGIAALAIEKGGHVRVGLEDHHAPPRLARNDELVAEVAALCRAAGRPPATVEDAPKILFG